VRRYASACVSVSYDYILSNQSLYFWIYKYIIWVRRRFSVAGARNALHGWCAWCRAPRSSRTSSTFSSRCASIREPTCHRTHLRPISNKTGRSLLPSSWEITHSHARHWTLTRLVLHLPLPPFPSFIQSTKNFLAPLRSAVESIVPADSAHYWILLVTLLVCPALILYGHHVETRYVSFIIFPYGQLD